MRRAIRLLSIPVTGLAVALLAALGPASAALASDAAPAQPTLTQQAPTQQAPAQPSQAQPAVAAAPGDVNDFSFSSFDARYDLGIDDSGHSTLETVETFVAEFPDTDQNHGIQRAIPLRYQGHPTDLTLESVTDAAGTPRDYDTETDDENLIVTIAADDYVHGEQSYVLTYTARDVTAYFANTDDDEFYRDTNGVLWQQPFARHTTTTVVAPDLVDALTGSLGCFVGPEGSGTECDIRRIDDTPATAEGLEVAPGSAVFGTSNENLGPGDNVTIGIAFAPHTFTERETAYFSAASSWVQAISTLFAVIVAVLAIVYRRTRLKDAPGRPVVVPEYTPPRDADLLIASAVMKRTQRGAAASFVDYAVRHNIQIVEQNEGGSSKTDYWLRLLTWQGLNDSELQLARALFGEALVPGTWRELKKSDAALSKEIYTVVQNTKKRSLTEGYFTSGLRGTGSLLLAAAFVFAGVGFAGGVLSIDAALGGGIPWILLFVAVATVVLVFLTAFRSPLTQKGAELRDYIEGIRMYVEWAEEERFRVLQSPEGALKTGVDAPDWGQVVKLYEKLLPYAVLLGLETEWAKVLGTYYESLGAQPEWYGGSGAFNAYLFASSIGSMSSTAASSYSGSSSSSSSGFSGGGGSSGGGGGGGGGGGV